MKKYEECSRESTKILESFDLGKTATLSNRVTQSQFATIMTDLEDNPNWTEQDYNEVREVIKKSLNYIRGYTFIDTGEKFLIFFLNNGNEVEVHFTNITQNKFQYKTNTRGKTSQIVFATVVKTTIDFLATAGFDKIRIKTNKDRERLYKKILDVTLEKYLSSWKFIKKESNKDSVDFVYKRESKLEEILKRCIVE